MRLIPCISLICLLIWSCGGSKGDDDTVLLPDLIDVVPTAPELVYPSNYLLCIDNTLNFEWKSPGNVHESEVIYQIELSKDNQFSEIAYLLSVDTTKQSITLEKGVAYYWRIMVTHKDSGHSTYSSTFNFYTKGAGITNHLPFAPELIQPISNGTEEEGTVELEWNGRDAVGDPLQFDLYCDQSNPPTTLVSGNQEATSYAIEALPNSVYYWKVIATDNKGGKAIGQVWTFRTQ